MVPPRPDNFDHHDAVKALYVNSGLYVAEDNLDSASVGDRTSQFRWFMFASKNPIESFNIARDSKMSCSPLGVSEILEDEASIDSRLYIPDSEASNLRVFAPRRVTNLFESFSTHCCSSPAILEHENAFACVLLTWHLDKTCKSDRCKIGISTSLGTTNFSKLSGPSEFYIFSLLFHSFKLQGVNSMMFNITSCSSDALVSPNSIRIGFTSDNATSCFMCTAIQTTSLPSITSIVRHMNSKCPGSARLVPGGVSTDFIFCDTRNFLRFQVLATMGHTFAFFNDKAKGSTVAKTTGPVPTITGDYNIIIDVSNRFPRHVQKYRYLTVREGARAKSFDEDKIKHLLSLDIKTACTKIAQAIPVCLLTAVYLTVYKEKFRLEVPPKIIDKCILDSAFSVHLHITATKFSANPGIIPLTFSDNIHLSKRKKASKAPKSGWRPLPDHLRDV